MLGHHAQLAGEDLGVAGYDGLLLLGFVLLVRVAGSWVGLRCCCHLGGMSGRRKKKKELLSPYETEISTFLVDAS